MQIELSRGMKAVVDKDSFELISRYTWHAARSSNAFYAATNVFINGKKRCVLMHRLLMDAPAGLTVDHINGNTLDNRKDNLRIATMQQNSWNRSTRAKSGYLGVKKAGKSWMAVIYPNLNSLSLGTYETKELAASAFNEGAKIIYGEFAKLNDVPDVGGLIDMEIEKRQKSILRLQNEISILRGER